MPLHWALTGFESLYESIQAQEVHLMDFWIKELADDLKDLNSTYPRKNDSSRSKLESGKIKISTDEEFEVNKDFILLLIQLSDDLNLDELVSAELIFHASTASNMGTSIIDSAKANFYLRRQNILSIVSYILNVHSDMSHVSLVASKENFFKSIQVVEDELSEIKNLIKRSQLLGNYHSLYFQQNVKFRRDFLYREHELLSEILLGLLVRKLLDKESFIKAYNSIDKYDPDDLFMIHYLPGLFYYCSQISQIPESDIKSLYSTFIKQDLNDVDKISNKPMKLAVMVVFMTYFTQWCNQDQQESKGYNFETDCSTPIATCIELGAFEQLMCVAADTTKYDETIDVIPSFYDFRSLLQQHLPKLFPKQILDVDNEATMQLKRKLQQENALAAIDEDSIPPIYLHNAEFQISAHFISLFIPIFTKFVEAFITTGAFMLTKLRDSEEDSLLSSENFNLEEISTKADLERFYLTVYYLYSARPVLASRFWEKTSELYGFIKWSSSSNSALMRSTFCLMLSAFASGERNAIETYNFLQSNSSVGQNSSTFAIHNTTSNIDWSSIYEDLSYYNKALSEPKQNENSQQLQLYSSFTRRNTAPVVKPELGEDAILFISGYFQVISQVAQNNDQTKQELFESDEMELPNILKSFLNNDTSLTGACLLTLRSLIGNKLDIRNKIWGILESWIFRSTKIHQYNRKEGSKLNIKKIFAQSLTSLDDIIGFVEFFKELLHPIQLNGFQQYQLLHPITLGLESGRKQGIYPYFEFLMEEVLVSSTQATLSLDERIRIRRPLLSVVLSALNSIEEKNLVEYSQHCNISKVDNLFEPPLVFKTFVELELSSLVMNFLFEDKVYALLFDIVSMGIDEISDKLSDSKIVETLVLGLAIINRVLSLQSYFTETAIPIIKESNSPIYVPGDFGTHGLRSFYDALLFRLPLLAHLLLYVGSQHTEVAKLSIEILTKIGESTRFNENSSNVGGKTILLTTFETIDESDRIKSAFIDQLSTEIINDENLTVKLKILKFLDKHLSNIGSKPSISHFLLGFELKGHNHLIPGDLDQDRSLFNTLLYILVSSIDSLQSGEDVHYAPMKLSAIVMEVLLKLCKNPISRSIVLPKLRNHSRFNLFLKVLSTSFNLDSISSLFEGLQFNSVLSNSNVLTTESSGIGALISFIQYRRFICEYLLIELNSASISGSLSLRNNYINALINGDQVLSGAPKILGFLDILEFNFSKIVEPFEMKLFGEFDYDYIVKNIKLKDYDLLNRDQPIYDLTVFFQCLKLKAIEVAATRPAEKASLGEVVEKESVGIIKYLINYSAYSDFKLLQLSCLKSWAFLIELLVTQGQLDDSTRSRVILEVLQSALPKINDYIELDISFAEELVSLCVLLYDQYDNGTNSSSFHGLLPIFQTCVHGITATHSTPAIRSDLYVLSNKYLDQIENQKELVDELLKSLNLENIESILKIIFNDSIVGESSTRVTSLLFLEKLCKLAARHDKLILQNLLRNDYLLLLVGSIKRTDELLLSCSKPKTKASKTTLYGLLYELTAFKTTLYFLIRVAETRLGAYKLIQSDVFNVIKNSSILRIDPDLGVDLKFEELNTDKEHLVITNLSLDTPLRLPSEYHSADPNSASGTTISLFEILIPIFQLLNAIAISMGPSNKPIITKTKELLTTVEKLVVGVLKRDAILENKAKIVNNLSKNVYHNDMSLSGLKNLVRQFTLLYSLIEE